MHARLANEHDLDALVVLGARRRARLESFQSRFWRRAKDADEIGRAFLSHLMKDRATVLLVAEDGEHSVRGCLQAKIVPNPPIYDPGGQTVMIDDFCVDDPANWDDIGLVLIDELRRRFADLDCAQFVVAVPEADQEASSFMRRNGFSVASQWWTAAVQNK